jgi:hypothetical protein
MFNPSEYIQTTPTLYGFIQETAQPSNKPYFYLLSDNNRLGNIVFGFPYIPSQLKFSDGANYNRITRSLGQSETLQYLSNKAQTISINGVMMNVRGEERTFQPIVDLIRELMLNQKKEPSYFSVCIQERVLYPYVLTDFDVTETGWSAGGNPIDGELSFSFVRSDKGKGDEKREDLPMYRTLDDFSWESANSEVLKLREEFDAQLTN